MSVPHQTEALNKAPHYYDYLQPSFDDYVSVSKQWLTTNRHYISSQQEKELAMNTPFSLSPAYETNKAILLVHGLGDSPYYYSDLAKTLLSQGFHVEVMLLPGHGSQPSDLFYPTYQDWQISVDHYANKLKEKYSEVWLGGFSTGANLIGIHALEHGGIEGLLFISPGFQTHVPFLEKLAPIAQIFTDWGWKAEESNFARYTSSPWNASIAYSESASKIRDLLKTKRFTIPTFVIMTEADSVIDPYAIKDLFLERMSHPHKKMLWYGEDQHNSPFIQSLSMRIPEQRISTGSHMNPLFSPDNSYFGSKGEKRMCGNGLSGDDRIHCLAGKDVWYSAWGYSEDDKIHARLTWNPYYKELEQSLADFFTKSSKVNFASNHRLSDNPGERGDHTIN